MQNLNERLASYLDKVSNLESSNQKLEQQIQNYLNQNVPEKQRDFTAKFQIVNELRQQIGDYFLAITKLNLQIEHAQFEFQDYQIKTEEEAKMCLSSEMEIHVLQELQRHGEAQRAELEFEISQREEEMAFLNTEREERLLEFGSLTSSGVNVELATKESADLIQVLQRLREECMTVVQKNQREVEQWFDKKMKELQAQETHNSTETESNTTGLRELKQTFQNLSIELQQLHLQMSILEQNKMEMTSRYSQCLLQYQTRVIRLEDELRRLRSDINQQGASYQQLLDIKTHLELEIAQYKRTLDGGGISECMSGSNIVAVPSSHGSSIDTSLKTSTATYTRDNKHTSSSAQAVYSSVDGHTGKTRREIIQSRFLSEGSAGTLVVQEQIIVSKQNRSVTSEKEQVGLSKSASSVQRSSISDLDNTVKTTTSQTSHLDSVHAISQQAPQKYSMSIVSETTELAGGSQVSESQVSTSLSDAAKSTHTTETVEIKSTAKASNASHEERSVGVKSTSEVLQTNLTTAGTQVVKTGKSSPEKLSRASIYEKVMLWNAPQHLSNVNIEESEMEVSVPESTVEIKTDTNAVSSSAMESLLNTSITTAAVEANISHGQVEISAPESTVDVTTTRTTVRTSALESVLNAGIASSAALFNSVQRQVEISPPESTVEVKTAETALDKGVKDSLLNSGIATSAVETSISQGKAELAALESAVEVRTTQVVGTSAMESLLNAGITTSSVLSNTVQGHVEISAPETTVEVKTTKTVVNTSAKESLLNSGSTTSAVETSIAQGQVEISAPESTVEVKTTKTVVNTSAKESLLNSGSTTSAVETSIAQGQVEISAPESTVEVKTTKTVGDTSAKESLLNSGSTTTAVETSIAQGQVEVSAPECTVGVKTTQVLGTSGVDSLLNVSITTSAVLSNDVQGQLEISAPESTIEVKTTRTTVGNSAMESLLNAGIARVAVESNTIQGEVEMSAPESIVEVKTSRTTVGTSAMESLLNAGIATSAILSNNVQGKVEISAPESAVEVKTTQTVVNTSAKESLLNSGSTTSAVETSISQGQVELSAPESTVEVKTTRTTVGTSALESLLNAGITTSAVLSNNVQDQVEISATESSASQNVVMTSVSEDAVDKKNRISESVVEPARLQSTNELRTVEVQKSEVVETQGTKSLSEVQTVASEDKTESKATGIVGHTSNTDTLLSTSFGNKVVETRVLSSIAEVSVADSTATSQSTSVETKSSRSSIANLQDVSNSDIPLPNGTKNRFELTIVGAGSTTQDRNPYLNQSALAGHVSLPFVDGGIEGLTLDGTPRYTGTSSQVIIGGSSREARISQARKITEGVQMSSSSPGSEGRMTRQSSSPKGRSAAGVVSAMMGSPRSGCRSTSPNRNVISSAGSQRTRLNSTGSVGSDSGIGCSTGMASYSSPTKPSTVSSAGTGVWIMSSDSDSPYTISTRSRGSGDKITTYGSGVSSGRISSAGNGNRVSSSGSGNRITYAGSGNTISYAGSGNRISYAGSGGRISSAGSGNRISSAGSGNRISSAGSGNRISSAGSGNRISSAGSGNRISSAGSGNRISSAGSGGRISTAGTGNSRISIGAPMGSSANMMVIRSTGSSGGGSNRDRISVCKMAALSKAAAVKEKSLGSQSLLHMKSASLEAGEDEELNIPAVP